MTTATIIASRKRLKSPHYLTPTRYDRDALAILDVSRISGVADGERITGAMARGNGSERLKSFLWNHRSVSTQAQGLTPFYRESGGPSGVPCLEFTGKESLRNGLDYANPLTMPFTLSMVVKIENYTNTNSRLAGRSQSGAEYFASVRNMTNSGKPTVALYTASSDLVYNHRETTDPRISEWIVVMASFQPHSVGPCAILFDDKYAEQQLASDTGSATNVLGTNYDSHIALESDPAYNTGFIGKYAEFRIDPYAMTETEMRKFRDDQMFRFGLT